MKNGIVRKSTLFFRQMRYSITIFKKNAGWGIGLSPADSGRESVGLKIDSCFFKWKNNLQKKTFLYFSRNIYICIVFKILNINHF